MNFSLNYASRAGLIAGSIDLQSNALPLCYGCPSMPILLLSESHTTLMLFVRKCDNILMILARKCDNILILLMRKCDNILILLARKCDNILILLKRKCDNILIQLVRKCDRLVKYTGNGNSVFWFAFLDYFLL